MNINRKTIRKEIIKELAFQKYKSIASVPLTHMSQEILISENRLRKKGYSKSYIMKNSLQIIEKYDRSLNKRILLEKESALSNIVTSIFPGAKGYVKELLIDYVLAKLGMDPNSFIGNLVANSLENLELFTAGYFSDWDNDGCGRFTGDLLEGLSEGLMQYLGTQIKNALATAPALADVIDQEALKEYDPNSPIQGIVLETAMEVINKYFIPELEKKVTPVICKIDFSKVLSKLNPFSSNTEEANPTDESPQVS